MVHTHINILDIQQWDVWSKSMYGYWNQWEGVSLFIWMEQKGSWFAPSSTLSVLLVYPRLQRNTKKYPWQARWEPSIFPSAHFNQQTLQEGHRKQRCFPKMFSQPPGLSAFPWAPTLRKSVSVKPVAVATGAFDNWSPAHTQPQQNPLKLPSAVSQHGTQELNCSSAFTAHGPALPALPLGQEPVAGSWGESHAAEQSSLCRKGRAPWFPPSPQQHQCCKHHLHPKDNLAKPARAPVTAKEKCASCPLLKLPLH